MKTRTWKSLIAMMTMVTLLTCALGTMASAAGPDDSTTFNVGDAAISGTYGGTISEVDLKTAITATCGGESVAINSVSVDAAVESALAAFGLQVDNGVVKAASTDASGQNGKYICVTSAETKLTVRVTAENGQTGSVQIPIVVDKQDVTITTTLNDPNKKFTLMTGCLRLLLPRSLQVAPIGMATAGKRLPPEMTSSRLVL